jgi:membrane protein DedA with SNARE-associated domain
MVNIQKFVTKYGWGVALIVAATPIPDDVVYIVLGFSKYNILKFIVATFFGKFLINEFLIVGITTYGKQCFERLLLNTGDHELLLMIGIIIAIITVVGIAILITPKIGSGRSVAKRFSF